MIEFTPFSYTIPNSTVERTLFIKKHDGDDNVKPKERTLYVVNIPQFLSDRSLRGLFHMCGPIEKVYLQSKPTSGLLRSESKYFDHQKCKIGSKVGYVIFKNSLGLKKALKPNEIPVALINESCIISGKQKWTKDYNSQFINAKDLLSEVEAYMSEFDKKNEEEKEKAKKTEGEADEDGWITVTKHSKKPKIPRNDVTSMKLLAKQKRAQAKMTLVNFYKSQLRDAKMDQMAEIRKKFENDKKRLALMKAGRKFKPL